MIIGDLKPIDEIAKSISGFAHVLVLGCGSCVTVCLSGGDREAQALSRELARFRHYKTLPPDFQEATIQRQCERDLVETYLNVPPETDAILSLACGAGVQTVSDVFESLIVIPALNTAASSPPAWSGATAPPSRPTEPKSRPSSPRSRRGTRTLRSRWNATGAGAQRASARTASRVHWWGSRWRSFCSPSGRRWRLDHGGPCDTGVRGERRRPEGSGEQRDQESGAVTAHRGESLRPMARHARV